MAPGVSTLIRVKPILPVPSISMTMAAMEKGRPCPPYSGALSMLPKDFVRDYYADQAREILEPVQAFAKERDWKLKTEARVGHASDVIADVAESGKYDLVVMGSHGRTGLMKVVVGSVVSQLLVRSTVPVLIIR